MTADPKTWTIDSLRRHLQWAVELELYTIPLYMATLYSLRDEWSYAYQLCRSVAVEEMLHLQLAANVLSAIGGRPLLTGSASPSYPSDLPFHKPRKKFHLRAASVAQFMDFVLLEKPDDACPDDKASRDGPSSIFNNQPHDAYCSIGDFYQAIVYGLEELGDTIFEPNIEAQVTAFGRHDIVVDNVDSAKRAINVIVSQGEGNRTLDGMEGMNDTNTDLDMRPSHYKRFMDVVKAGKEQFSDDRVYSMAIGPPQQKLPNDVAALSDLSDAVYSRLLFQLERGFNGSPATISRSVGGLMYQAVRPLSVLLMKQPVSSTHTAGPRFKWVDDVTIESLNAQWRNLPPHYKTELGNLQTVLQQQI